MGRSGRFKIDVRYACLLQRRVKVLRIRPFLAANSEEKHLHLLIKGACIGEDAIVRSLGVKRPGARPVAAAKSANVAELIQVTQTRHERLHPTHGKSRHSA